MRSCLGIIAWTLIFALAFQFLQTAPWLVFVFAAIVAIGVWLSKAKRAAIELDTLKAVGDKPLGNILNPEKALVASGARMLVGDESFSFEVVGESFYPQNYAALQKNIGLEDGRDWDVEAVLIVDPGNRHSHNAVAVFVSGLKLGYVPETTAAAVYKFLLQNGGFAKADGAIYFSSKDGKNSLWLDVVIPLSFRP